MKKFAISLIFLNSLYAIAQANVGVRLPSAMIPKNNTNECAATPSQTYPCLQDVEIAGVRFTVVGYDARSRRIRYLFTQDENFKTADRLQVGGPIELADDQILVIAGWHIIGPRSKDGWRPILGSVLDENVIETEDGNAVDLTKPIAGRMHRFKIVGFDKGGV